MITLLLVPLSENYFELQQQNAIEFSKNSRSYVGTFTISRLLSTWTGIRRGFSLMHVCTQLTNKINLIFSLATQHAGRTSQSLRKPQRN